MTSESPAVATPAPDLGTADKRLLERIFQHPLSHHLSWRETLALFTIIGAVERAHDGDTVLHLGGQHQAFKPAHDKDLRPEDVIALRHLMARAAWDEGTPRAAATPSSNRVVVIDHAEARVYAIPPDDASGDGSGPQELHHLYHDSDRTRRDADRDETWPDDTRFFAEVARALDGDGQIVVVGHGTGQSNEAGHLMAWLAVHDAAVHARVARQITADLSHQTLRQILALARDALRPAPFSAKETRG